MEKHDQKINQRLMVGWGIIVLVLILAYLGEYWKGVRTGSYMLAFSLATVLPPLGCLWLYLRRKDSPYLRYAIIAGYSVMYVFVLMTGSTTMVFTYIFPLLTLIVLYHQPKLVLSMGIVSLLANIAYDVKLALDGKVTLENSKDMEIQLALIILCFGFLYAASQLYDEIQRKNEEYLREIQQKNQEIQQVTLETITTIVSIIDAKDEYTKGHSQRVAEYAAALARELGYSQEDVNRVQYIALLHDIGKVGIPDSILKKSARLSQEEYDVMKQHVTIGNKILQDNSVIRDLAKGAQYHHERYDGHGYSQGLKGEDIPEVARIICLADSYDAMTSDRVYRPRLSDEAVMEELRKNSGTQFDPKLVEVFIRMLGRKNADLSGRN